MIYFCSNKKELLVPDGVLTEEIKVCEVDYILNYFSNVKSIAVDTETAGRDPHIKGIISLQLGTPEDQFVIDCRDINILHFKELLENNLVLLHNSKFDYKFLKTAGINIENIYDTMLAECVLYCGYQKYGYGLKDLTKRYIGIDMNKETRGEFFMLKDRPFSISQIIYAATDVKYLHQIRDKQLKRAEEEDLLYTINLENEAVKALADIEYNGMYLNAPQWLKNTFKYEKELDAIVLELDALVLADPILSTKIAKNAQLDLFATNIRTTKLNYSSPLQMLKLLRFLGFDVMDSSDRTLSKLKHPFVEKLQKYREFSTIVNRYGRNFIEYINKNTNRVHTDFWQVLNTGRISSGSDELKAPNLQNIPADNSFRNCFQAREGYMWISVDYSSQELRLMADGSNESAFIDCINRDEDLHCYAGSMMFKRPITKADKQLRDKAKTINFGKPYGMGPHKLADTLSISIQEAEELFKLYSESFPALNSWLDLQAQFAVDKGYSLTFAPCKRRRYYPELQTLRELRAKARTIRLDLEEWKLCNRIEGQVRRNGMNMPIQGSGADICKEALIAIRKLILEYNNKYNSNVAYLICTVHDAIDVEVREDLAQEFGKIMCKLMIDVGNKYVSRVTMAVDLTCTKEWSK